MGNVNDAALYKAARAGDVETVRNSLKSGANPNRTEDENVPHGWGPLHVAANYNKADVCKLLLQRGADINAPDKLGNTPLDIAQKRGMRDDLQKIHEEVVAGLPAMTSPMSPVKGRDPAKPRMISAQIKPKPRLKPEVNLKLGTPRAPTPPNEGTPKSSVRRTARSSVGGGVTTESEEDEAPAVGGELAPASYREEEEEELDLDLDLEALATEQSNLVSPELEALASAAADDDDEDEEAAGADTARTAATSVTMQSTAAASEAADSEAAPDGGEEPPAAAEESTGADDAAGEDPEVEAAEEGAGDEAAVDTEEAAAEESAAP